ncbi:hypothetical protein [Spiroplasma sp. SV19]|uniref:hypothetical protein n=1 Tax=Spiroplasma sp. SV19 TaxID=2570468 RepID=UPI0024B6DD4D|nr:hypothetical protein [Spiroplasma sp. SV19]WHQ36950.1 hypothetical protein E7Y35_03505 [Spiroplasma sp. SV19]
MNKFVFILGMSRITPTRTARLFAYDKEKSAVGAPVDVSGAKVSGLEDPITFGFFNDPTKMTKKELDQLNKDAYINKCVTDAIEAVPGVTPSISEGRDYWITNDAEPGDYSYARPVNFTVHTKGDKISGTFGFVAKVRALRYGA